MSEKNPKVDAFLNAAATWREEFAALRAILLACPLSEDLKWGVPCYTLEGKNVVLMHGFKDYCALLFIKGALIGDSHGLLIQQTENVQAGRQVRFANVREIVERQALLAAYVHEAIEIEKAGLKVVLKPVAQFAAPEEFQARLAEDPALAAAFAALTPGRQRAYLLHFSAPKQAKTRTARVEKWAPAILAGKGLDD